MEKGLVFTHPLVRHFFKVSEMTENCPALSNTTVGYSPGAALGGPPFKLITQISLKMLSIKTGSS